MPQTHVDAVLGLDAYLTNADVIKNIQQDVDHIAKAGGDGDLWFSKPDKPVVGDIYYQTNANGTITMQHWDGAKWVADISTADLHAVSSAVAEQQKSIASAEANISNAMAAASSAVAAAGFDSNVASEASEAANDAKAAAATAATNASSALANAQTALTTAATVQTEVDDIAGTIKTLATTETVDQLAGTVATTQSLAQFAADGLKLKADTTTVDQINGTVNDLKGELDVQADKIAATVTASVQNMTSDMATQTWTQGKLDLTANGLTSKISSVQNGLNEKYTSLQQTLSGVQATANNAVTQAQLTLLSDQFTSKIGPIDLTAGTVSSQITQLKNDINLRVKTGDLVSQINVSSEGILIDGRKVHITGDTTIDTGVIKTAMIADASILDAKIVSLDGSKIVAHSITADKLDVNAIAVGLNTYGTGWQITPAMIAFLPSTSSNKASLTLTGDGIILGDTVTGETLGEITGSPYNLKTDSWFNGFNTILKYNGADYWAVLSEESNGTVRPQLMYSRNRIAELGVFQGWTFDDKTHFATIGAQDPDDKAQMHVVRTKIAGHWSTGFMANDERSGIAFGDGGSLYLERDNKWIDFYNIVNKIGL
ncbi:hypothetical protein [Loigolactobacillus backii]|uniref:hypothetical protein n=1 Tax=Loigolactobacillus backii TaxID=375175 RepID=UPI001958DB04|nr:hypothetical protein [Loigolactobacillus backii]